MKVTTCLDRNLRLDDEMSDIDIRYADDIPLVTAIFDKFQISTIELKTLVINEV